MRNQATFKLSYDGLALGTHEMDVRLLAPALHAVGDLLDAANRVINKDHTQISVKVRGSFKTGSFPIEYVVDASTLSWIKSVLTNEYVSTAKEILEWLGLIGTPGGLVYLLKKFRGRQPRRVIELENGRVRFELDDGESLEADKEELALYQDYNARRAIEEIIYTPLSQQGIDTLRIGDKNGENFQVSKEETHYFKAPPSPEEAIADTEATVPLQLVGVVFQEDNKWRFSDGASSFYATIFDENFLSAVQKSEVAFRKGDVLMVRLRKQQWLTGDGRLKTEHSVLQIIDHRPAAAQIPLPFFPKKDTEE